LPRRPEAKGTWDGGRQGSKAWWRHHLHFFSGEKVMSASSDEAARQLVLKTLREPAVGQLSYRLGSFVMVATDYERVAKAIDKKLIAIVDNPDFVNNALYDSGPNRFTIAAAGDNLNKRSLIIHEATHAVEDARGMKLTHGDAEMLAYVSQCLYLEKSGSPVVNYTAGFDWDMGSMIGWNLIFQRAAAIAALIHKGKPVPQIEIDMLRLGLHMAQWYRDVADSPWPFDGVGDETPAEKPPTQQRPEREWRWSKF
jgi:hypothetical protein